MRIVLVFGFLIFVNLAYGQEDAKEQFVSQVCESLINMEGLSRYSNRTIADDVTVNSVLADKVKVDEISENTFSISVDHGKGKFCTVLKFEYTKVDDSYYLVFPPVRSEEVFGSETKFVDPWTQRESDC
ncbi:hypothetical protein [Halocola ammonii]